MSYDTLCIIMYIAPTVSAYEEQASMSKIKFICDSNCDIPFDTAQKLDIDILSFAISFEGQEYREGISFTPEEYYEKLISLDYLPATAQIPPAEFAAALKRAYEGGYDCAIVTTMTSAGSGTYQSALLGRELFYEACPRAGDSFAVHILDSGNYSIAYGNGVLRGARAHAEGAGETEVLEIMNRWFSSLETYFCVFTLKWVSRSGRISSAVSTVCDMLGICPVLQVLNGVFTTIKKPRGRKAALRHVAEKFRQRWDRESDYVFLRSISDAEANELAAQIEAIAGKPPVDIFYAGASISTNTGPYITGTAFMAKETK